MRNKKTAYYVSILRYEGYLGSERTVRSPEDWNQGDIKVDNERLLRLGYHNRDSTKLWRGMY